MIMIKKYYCILILTFFIFPLFISACSQTTSSVSGGSSYTIVQVSSSDGDYDPTFSPDGNYMIYDQRLSDGNHELWKVNLNNLSDKISLGKAAEEASWNPADSNKIAFIKMDNSTGQWGGEAIYLMNASGESITKIAPTGSATPAWSMDGQYLLYELGRNIYKMKADGSVTVQLTSREVDGDCSWPSFSYDGTKILFVKRSKSTDQGGNIWIMDTDGSNKKELYAPSDGQCIIFQQAWNKYDEIVFMKVFEASVKKAPQVYLIKSDGSGLLTITSDENTVSGDPVWDSEGKRIALIRGPASNVEPPLQNVYYLIYRN
jgi:Tol biopolymer transport system component